MSEARKTFAQVGMILAEIDLGVYLYQVPVFKLLEKGDGFLLQLCYMEPDTAGFAPHRDSPLVVQKARKWYVSASATESEIVRTAWKALLCSLEHRAGEHFRYRGRKVYGPHASVEALAEVADRTDKRAT